MNNKYNKTAKKGGEMGLGNLYEVGLRKYWVNKMKKFPIKNLIKLSVVSIVAIVGLFVFSNGAEAAFSCTG